MEAEPNQGAQNQTKIGRFPKVVVLTVFTDLEIHVLQIFVCLCIIFITVYGHLAFKYNLKNSTVDLFLNKFN